MSSRTGALLVVTAALLFSAKAVVVKLAYPHGVDAATLLALRMLYALPCYLALIWWTGRSAAPLSARQRWAVFGLGLLGYYVSSILDFSGLQHIGAALERTVLYLYPLLTIAFAALGERRAPSRLVVGAGLAALFGIALTCAGHGGAGDGRTALGVALVAASAVCFALYITLSAAVMRTVGSQRFTALSIATAALGVLVHFALTHPLTALAQPAVVQGWALVLAGACTVLPSFAFAAGLKASGPTRTAVLSAVGPVGTVALAWLLLDERVSLLNGAGMALTIAAGVVVGLKPAARPAQMVTATPAASATGRA